jgi:hypothetical protein
MLLQSQWLVRHKDFQIHRSLVQKPLLTITTTTSSLFVVVRLLYEHMLVPQVQIVGLFERLHCHYFNRTPGMLVVPVIDDDDHGVALCDDHGQGRDTGQRVVLVDAGMMLLKRGKSQSDTRREWWPFSLVL